MQLPSGVFAHIDYVMVFTDSLLHKGQLHYVDAISAFMAKIVLYTKARWNYANTL